MMSENIVMACVELALEELIIFIQSVELAHKELIIFIQSGRHRLKENQP